MLILNCVFSSLQFGLRTWLICCLHGQNHVLFLSGGHLLPHAGDDCCHNLPYGYLLSTRRVGVYPVYCGLVLPLWAQLHDRVSFGSLLPVRLIPTDDVPAGSHQQYHGSKCLLCVQYGDHA